ncbi:MAG: hypothetical protein IPQ21_22330 [Betaproteobacteria bacterium]|nr:hypothetical protein [Betaproteobacteria bacterium]
MSLKGWPRGANGHRRVGLYTQLHHAAVDGQAAVALANAIMDLSPVPRAVEARSSRRNKVFRLEMTEMLRGVLGNQAQKVAEIVRGLPATVGTLKNAASRAISLSAARRQGGRATWTLAPRTPLNVSVTTGRAFAAVTAAAGRGEGTGPRTRRHHQRHGAHAVQQRAPPALRQAPPAAAQEPGGRGADHAARGR